MKTRLFMLFLMLFLVNPAAGQGPEIAVKGQQAEFSLKIGQTATIVAASIGRVKVRLSTLNKNSVNLDLDSENNLRFPNMSLNKNSFLSFRAGGSGQTARIYLLEIKDGEAKFNIKFESAPPSPEIPRDMSIKIIYS